MPDDQHAARDRRRRGREAPAHERHLAPIAPDRLGRPAEPLARRHGLAGHYIDAAPAHVAVLGGPSRPMADDDAVAAFVPLHGLGPARLADADVLHAVAPAPDDAGRRGEDRHPFFHGAKVADGDIGAFVAVIANAAVGIVGDPPPGSRSTWEAIQQLIPGRQSRSGESFGVGAVAPWPWLIAGAGAPTAARAIRAARTGGGITPRAAAAGEAAAQGPLRRGFSKAPIGPWKHISPGF